LGKATGVFGVGIGQKADANYASATGDSNAGNTINFTDVYSSDIAIHGIATNNFAYSETGYANAGNKQLIGNV